MADKLCLGVIGKEGGKADFILKFIFQAFNNLKLHKAVEHLEHFGFSSFSNVSNIYAEQKSYWK